MFAKIKEVTDVHFAIHRTNPETVTIWADGIVPTTGWSDGQLSPLIYIHPPSDGIQEFDFIARPPAHGAIRVDRPIEAMVFGIKPDWMKGVRIVASENTVEIVFDDKSKEYDGDKLLRGQDVPWPVVTAGGEIPWPLIFGLRGTDVPWPWV